MSSSYVIVNDGSSDNQRVLEFPAKVVRSGPIKAAALWYDTLWTTGDGWGVFVSTNLKTGAQQTVKLNIPCATTELQAARRWLYWSCGANGPAGVYDSLYKTNTPIPAGPALLGDGFVVRHDGATASLVLTDVHTGAAPEPVKLADLPVGNPADGRGLSWAVDRHGNGVAYVDAENAVHVLDTGVPVSGAGIGSSQEQKETHPRLTDWYQYWRGTFQVTRPLWSWEVTITRKTTGEVVSRQSGGVARRQVAALWDGRLASGEPAMNGVYRWELRGSTRDGGDLYPVGQGELRVTCGTFGFHSYDCYGSANLLGVKSTGEGHWYGEQLGWEPAGHLYDLGATDKWCLSCTGAARTSALVPFGDYDGDGTNDLLVRDGDGGMRAYRGSGRPNFDKSSLSYVSLGRGWMMYRSLLAPGDVNSDGYADLLGIDTYGKLWLYTTTGKGGLNPRVQVGSGWNTYKRVIGAGDLNGDGHGDLLGIDAYGVMYRYLSNGNKGWSSRAKVFSGWNIYNTVVAVGDLNLDDRLDLVARDANGVLWFYAGLGNGSFAPRVQKGTGWNTYKVIV